ncbi:hypothetical protein BJV82DRAFT_138909 [Fennellomyces sp. T-0311]|nr:hypothetical protein BJV82DRAFT_138909 [Fennellomyces sp. T-0311]
MFRSVARSLLHKRTFISTVAKESVKVDSDCLPLTATWSIRTLLDANDTSPRITDEQFNHLFRLAQLRPPESQKAKDNLKRDLDQISRFTEQIEQLALTNAEPMVQLWETGVGMTTRADVAAQDAAEPRGRELLENAEQTHGNFYVVQSKIASAE